LPTGRLRHGWTLPGDASDLPGLSLPVELAFAPDGQSLAVLTSTTSGAILRGLATPWRSPPPVLFTDWPVADPPFRPPPHPPPPRGQCSSPGGGRGGAAGGTPPVRRRSRAALPFPRGGSPARGGREGAAPGGGCARAPVVARPGPGNAGARRPASLDRRLDAL